MIDALLDRRPLLRELVAQERIVAASRVEKAETVAVASISTAATVTTRSRVISILLLLLTGWLADVAAEESL